MSEKKEKKYIIDNPVLMAEWNWEKNNELGLDPKTLTLGSGKKVWWKCNKGHEWLARIADRNNGKGCPYCSNQKAIKGYNDLATINPKLVSEWNYEKNGDLKPEDFMPNSNKKVWWKCAKGHEWQAKIANRNNGNNCPICSSEMSSSFPEYAVLYYLEKYGIKVVHRYKGNGYELDIYIPHKKIAIEYDGYFYHKNKTKKDLEKNLKCKKDGIKLYRIREGLPLLNDTSIDYVVDKKQKELGEVLKKVLSEILGCGLDIDLKRDTIGIENLREYTEKSNSLLFTNPELAKEWNYEKNGSLMPEHFLPNSDKKVWWKCEKGHEWQAIIANRSKGSGCPYCSGNKVLRNYNDLVTVNPKLASELNYEKNGELKPEDFMPNSNKKVWWKCAKGHEWQATINNRNNGQDCPICASKKVLSGYNDLVTVNPKLASEWNYGRNGSLRPEEFTANSGVKVWWKCYKGHEWQSTIAHRNNGRGCPYCTGKQAIKGESDLATINPNLANEWNYEKNGELKPEDFMPNSNKKVWWKCSKGHEWQATIASRNSGRGCPYCAGRKKPKQ
ncbi:MAG: hypothetical protein IKB67_01690 [Clostridia bacterium]|nr:hypothetical protein [Clostridia bacterium]